ncbi:MAG: acyl carrier protein [Candidatus Marinimicrobia bacterium]|nr:acyl carrier protein [Candidatus Neomarinimicrobiota bacterium]|tara:strand:+ start:15118 stop:15354 length:237 start_codon:yes stop_codon:yes gene_type:complete
MTDDLLKKIAEIVVEKLDVPIEKVTGSAKFIDDLGADSLDTVELIMQFEEDFDIDIPDEDAEKILSVQDALDYIKNNK